MRRVHADLLLLACAAIWGFALLFQKSAMAHIEPLLFIGARGFVAAVALTPFILLERRRSEAPSGRRLLAMSALAGSAFLVANYLQQRGLQTASVMNAGFLTGLYVVATPFISFALMGRAIAPAIWAAVALSFAGMWLLGGGTLGGFGDGDALVAISALFWAVHLVLLGMAAPLGRVALFTALQFLLIGIVATIGALLREPVGLAGLRAAAVDILYVGVLAGALTFAAFTLALRATSPTEAAVIVSTDTVFAACGAWLVLGETLTPIRAIGAAAILAAILTVQLASARDR
jgi:drug/metabolite transporter (DMT)-like permease